MSKKWLGILILLVFVASGFIYAKSKLTPRESWFTETNTPVRKVVFEKGLPSLSELVKGVKPAVVNISTTTVVKGLDMHERFFGPSNPPNPFKDFTDIVFEHNQQDVDFSIRAEIYSMAGQLIRTIEQTGPQSGSVSSPLHWDGLSNLGSDVPQGMYVYNIMVTSSNGLYGQTSGKLIYQK